MNYSLQSYFSVSLALLLGAGACTRGVELKGDGKSGVAKSETSAASGENADSKNNGVPMDENIADEKIDPPANISGAFLHCAVEIPATDTKFEAMVGCRFDDANGVRVPAASLSKDIVYTYRPAPVPSLKVYPSALAGDNRYDAVYLMFAESKAAIDQALADTRIFVKMKDAGDVSGLLKDVTVDAASFPEAKTTDYNAVRDQVITDAANNEPVPPVPQ